jgi:hypothetical protein
MVVDLQVVTSPGFLFRLLFMVVGSTLIGISSWIFRRGGCRSLGTMVGWL